MLKISEEGLRRLQEVKAYVMAEPRRFVMQQVILPEDEIAPCGTACCIAGHLILLSVGGDTEQVLSRMHGFPDWASEASNLLGIANQEYYGSDLFHQGRWPKEYRDRYDLVGDEDFESDEDIEKMLADGTLDPDDFVDGRWAHGPFTKKNVADARINNAKVMCDLIDEICERGGLWWVEDPIE